MHTALRFVASLIVGYGLGWMATLIPEPYNLFAVPPVTLIWLIIFYVWWKKYPV